jgi:hypothetical protein
LSQTAEKGDSDLFYGLSAHQSTPTRRPSSYPNRRASPVAAPTPRVAATPAVVTSDANTTVVIAPAPVVVVETNTTTSADLGVANTTANAIVSTSTATEEESKPNQTNFAEISDDKKYRGSFSWWIVPLVVIGVILIFVLLFFTMSKKKEHTGKIFIVE